MMHSPHDSTEDSPVTEQVAGTVDSSTTGKTAVKKNDDHVFSLRLKAPEWAVIQQDVAASGLSKNAYFRQLALDAPVPRKAPKRFSGEQGLVYARWLGELGKIGSNLNQITRQLNTAMKTDPSQRPDNEALLEVVEQVQVLLEESAAELRQTLSAKQS